MCDQLEKEEGSEVIESCAPARLWAAWEQQLPLSTASSSPSSSHSKTQHEIGLRVGT